jgi:hypothetical protein
MSATPAIASKATRREWIGLAVIALPCLLYSMDLMVLNLAVPHLSADLRPTSSQLLWIVDIYGFMIAGFLITMGHIGRPHRPPPAASDRRRRVWRSLGTRCVVKERGDADRDARGARHCRGDTRAVDALADS